MKNIQKAINLLAGRAGKYTPKENAYYLIVLNEEDFERTPDLPDGLYCEDCIDSTIAELETEHPDLVIDYDRFNDPYGNMPTCDCCGEKINETVCTDRQELEHWAESDLNNILTSDADFFELHKILSDEQFDKEHKKYVTKIVNRVIKFMTQHDQPTNN